MSLQITQKFLEDAKKIKNLGWRQGSIFLLNKTIIEKLIFDFAEQDLFIIASQSCSVVSSRFEVDPLVEAMAIRKLEKFNQRSHEATGKNQRKLHLKLMSFNHYQAVECDLNKRFFSRELL